MRARTAAIIPAAGSGSRMQAEIPKQFLELAGKPLLVHTIAAFVAHPSIDCLVVAVAGDRLEPTGTMLARHFPEESRIVVVAGGDRRQDSVYNGLAALGDDIEAVLVHDGARPLVSGALIERCCRSVVERGTAIAALPVKDTLKAAAGNGTVAGTVDRAALWQAQTPQGARRALLEKAYRLNGGEEVTDESALLEKAAIPVHIVMGEEKNFKITTPEDLRLAESLLAGGGSWFRVGHGFDAHRFADGRKLVLGGVEIDHVRGLAGHSDADVLCHALCDALLGALGEGDIGRHFPDSDEEFRGISSLLLVDRVMALCLSRRMRVGNADLTVVCQAPRLAPHIGAMRELLARRLGVERQQLNIKATTTEKMGYTGREEGIACHAVVLLVRE